jgi:hypothetical protein
MKLSGIQYTRTTTADHPQGLDGAGERGHRSRARRLGSCFLLPQHGSDLPNGGPVKTRPEQKMRKKKNDPEELLMVIAEAVDDGFCPASSLVSRFPKRSHRDLVRLRGQAVRRGLLLERRGPDGQAYLALTSEGWRALRSSRTFSPSMNQMRRPSG